MHGLILAAGGHAMPHAPSLAGQALHSCGLPTGQGYQTKASQYYPGK